MIGDGHILIEPSGNHLSPAGPGLCALVGDGGVAAEIDGRTYIIALNMNTGDGRCIPVKLKCEFLIPCECALLSLFYLHSFLVIDIRSSFIYHKLIGGRLSLACLGVLHHQTSCLGSHCRGGCPLL